MDLQSEADDLNNKGLEHLKRKAPSKAIEYFNKAIKLVEDEPSYWINKGTAYRKLGNFEDALKCYDTAIKIDENLYFTWYNKGLIDYEINNIDSAIENFLKSVDIDPSFHKGWYRLGLCFLKKDNIKKSYKCFKQAYELDKTKEKYSLKVNEIKFDYDIINLSNALTKFENIFKYHGSDYENGSPEEIFKPLKEGTIEMLKNVEHNLSRLIINSKNILYKDSLNPSKDNSALCVICLEKDRCKVCIPCNHLCLCEDCSQKVDLCPVCRKKIESFIRVYM